MISIKCMNQQWADRRLVWRSTIQQGITYSVIGGSSTLLDFALFNLLVFLWSPSHSAVLLLISAVCALASSLNSYVGHRRWTFKQPAGRLKSFLTLNALTFGVNIVLVLGCTAVLSQMLNVSSVTLANLSKIFAVGGSGMTGFLGNKYWVFRQ